MGCGCTSTNYSSAVPLTVGVSGCLTTSGVAQCPIPKRTSNPPTTPVIWKGADRLQPAFEAKLMGTRCNGEVVNIDGAADGVWLFNAETGNSYVGTPVIDYVRDSLACEEGPLFGFPAYGAAPGCRQPGENPDRIMAFVRPGTASSGMLFAHQKSCCGVSGFPSEMTPVEILPDVLPTAIPSGFRTLGYVRTDGDSCSPVTMKWYGTNRTVADEIPELYVDLPSRAWTSDDNAEFGIGVWVAQSGGGWALEKADDATFQAYITKFAYKSNYLNPRTIVATQEAPEPFNYTFNVDLRAQPGYSADATEVQLQIETTMVSPVGTGSGWNFFVDVQGVRKYRTTGGPAAAGNADSGEIHVPIPPSKILTIAYVKDRFSNGSNPANYPYNACSAYVYLEAFK